MYKKSYTGFIWWMVAFVAALLAIIFLPTEDARLLMRLILLLTAWAMAGLTFIIWRTERVYWYNSTTYEEAEAAGSERRKDFAWQHFRVFGGYALVLTVIVVLMHVAGMSAWIDFTAGAVGLIAAALYTIRFKL